MDHELNIKAKTINLLEKKKTDKKIVATLGDAKIFWTGIKPTNHKKIF